MDEEVGGWVETWQGSNVVFKRTYRKNAEDSNTFFVKA